jgi:hypothetical protein
MGYLSNLSYMMLNIMIVCDSVCVCVCVLLAMIVCDIDIDA